MREYGVQLLSHPNLMNEASESLILRKFNLKKIWLSYQTLHALHCIFSEEGALVPAIKNFNAVNPLVENYYDATL